MHEVKGQLQEQRLKLLSIKRLQDVGGAEDLSVTCSISVSDPVSSLDSITLTVHTPGQDCSFTVTSLDSGVDGAECRRRRKAAEELETNEIGGRKQGGEEEEVKGEVGGLISLGTNQLGVEDRGNKGGGDVFTCELTHLVPGTAHLLQVRSQKDEEAANVTVHTSKS
ncbi:hypothetical protein INR49_019406 [Caranx melampygus]|nr:hypothetical protein INR49_019406 [Caranx melampygus]